MARGDHIRVRRLLYWHHGIDCGDGTVVHYRGEPLRLHSAAVERTTLEAFACGCPVQVVSYEKDSDAELVLGRALARLGEAEYSVVFNNCEHFARWCRTGKHKSRQVRRVAGSMATMLAMLLTVLVFRSRLRRLA